MKNWLLVLLAMQPVFADFAFSQSIQACVSVSVRLSINGTMKNGVAEVDLLRPGIGDDEGDDEGYGTLTHYYVGTFDKTNCIGEPYQYAEVQFV